MNNYQWVDLVYLATLVPPSLPPTLDLPAVYVSFTLSIFLVGQREPRFVTRSSSSTSWNQVDFWWHFWRTDFGERAEVND